ncbi:hypothetical protein ACROYT_G028362 [Oculina patagonica]
MVIPDNLCENDKQLLQSLNLEEDEINELETQTRKQADCEKWKEERKFRFTASQFHLISKRQRNHGYFAEQLINPTPVSLKYLEQGQKFEPVVLMEYEKFMFNRVSFLFGTKEHNNDPPKVQIVNPVSKVVEARVGSSTSFTCYVSGMPLPSIRWMRQSGSSVNEIAADNGKYQVDSSPGSSQLIIKNISVDDQGYYICNASNFVSHLDRVFLGVISLITSTDSCPSTNQHALRGVPTTICCPVRGFPPPDVTWTLPDGTVQKTGNTILPITPKTNDFGKYTCIAEGLKKTDPDPVIVSIILREERLNIVEIAANNNTQLKKGDKFKWTKVEGAQNYICRVYGADIDSKTFLAAEISIEIPYSELTFKAPNKIPDPVKVSIRVLAIDEDNVIGRGGPFAAGK